VAGVRVVVDGRAASFGAGPVVVGRSSDCDVVVGRNDPRVSRRHASIKLDGAGWIWEDTSRRGSWVGDEQHRQLAIRATGIRVRLGAADGPMVEVQPIADAEPPIEVAPHVDDVLVRSGGAEVRAAAGRRLLVGRDPRADLRVDTSSVSREHVAIEWRDGAWTVEDLSSNGTFRDGTRVGGADRVEGPQAYRLGAPDGPVVEVIPGAEPIPDGGEAATPRIPGRSSRSGPSRSPDSVEPSPGSVLASHVVSGTIRIGRAPENDVVLEDLTVSRRHAELRPLDRDRYELTDLGSRVGTFVDGRRVSTAVVEDGALIGIGRHVMVLRDGRLDAFVDDGVTLEVTDLSVSVPGRRLLEGVSFTVRPGQLVAVVGPSGAGKSTLLRSLTGVEPQAGSAVRYNGRDLRSSIDELRYRIGYVPQEDILHTSLRLRQALSYAAELRFAHDVSASERDRRVDEVIGELGLADRADLQISRLSGGQRKRASVALELLTRPALLYLDEPTSGLDPGLERSVMGQLRELADEGRTVLVITHAVASLRLCDRVLFLAPGGRVAYYGPPDEALAYFGCDDYPDVFDALDRGEIDWGNRFRSDPAWRRWVGDRSSPPAGARSGGDPAPTRRQGPVRQLATLSRRALTVLLSTPAYAGLLVAQAPAIALLVHFALGTSNLDGHGGKPRPLLAVLVLSAATMGLVNSCREIVRELAIYRRERTVGLSLVAYLSSKALCVGILGALQAAILTAVVLRGQGGPSDTPLLHRPELELGLIVFATLVATMALGLAVSAIVSSDSTALVMIPVLIIGQLLLANAFLDIEEKPGLAQAALVSPSFWGMRALAADSGLLETEHSCVEIAQARAELKERKARGEDIPPEVLRGLRMASAPSCPGSWTQSSVHALQGLGGLGGLTVAYSAVALVALRRRDPL
jgi:ABC-type multidrug transport system ATPase subunit/pSer/pThr/pTyr-binding forkhead associated (FHA) protein